MGNAVFIVFCMVVIAASAGATVYLGFGFSGAEAIMVALAVLTVLGLYNIFSTRMGARSVVGSQLGATGSSFSMAKPIASSAPQVSAKMSSVLGPRKFACAWSCPSSGPCFSAPSVWPPGPCSCPACWPAP